MSTILLLIVKGQVCVYRPQILEVKIFDKSLYHFFFVFRPTFPLKCKKLLSNHLPFVLGAYCHHGVLQDL